METNNINNQNKITTVSYRITYHSPHWVIELENSHHRGAWRAIRETEQKERLDDWGSKIYYYPIKTFSTQKEAYAWITANLETGYYKEYNPVNGFFSNLFFKLGIVSPFYHNNPEGKPL